MSEASSNVQLAQTTTKSEFSNLPQLESCALGLAVAVHCCTANWQNGVFFVLVMGHDLYKHSKTYRIIRQALSAKNWFAKWCRDGIF